jgi:hypothetical protein
MEVRYEARKAVDADTRAAAIALHTVWVRALGTVTATDSLHDLEDFLRLLARRSVIKALAWEGTELVGVAFLTNELDTVPRIAAEFFKARFEQETRQGEVWYLMGGIAHPLRRGVTSGLAQTLVEEAKTRRVQVLLWEASTLSMATTHRSTVEAVTEVFGVEPDPEELDRVSYLAIRLPQEADVIDLRS